MSNNNNDSAIYWPDKFSQNPWLKRKFNREQLKMYMVACIDHSYKILEKVRSKQLMKLDERNLFSKVINELWKNVELCDYPTDVDKWIVDIEQYIRDSDEIIDSPWNCMLYSIHSVFQFLKKKRGRKYALSAAADAHDAICEHELEEAINDGTFKFTKVQGVDAYALNMDIANEFWRSAPLSNSELEFQEECVLPQLNVERQSCAIV